MGAFSTSEPGEGLGDAGDRLAMLFVDERVGLIRMATLLVGSHAVAEEVVQDAFIAVGDRWSTVERPGAYLRTSVVHGCAAVLRRREIEDRYSDRWRGERLDEIPSQLVELRDALDHLTERQRIVVVLRYFVDLPDNEIASVLSVRPSTVRSLTRRALSTLRKELS
jgi:RNA polymerase sigma factor (sigma-70 family)